MLEPPKAEPKGDGSRGRARCFVPPAKSSGGGGTHPQGQNRTPFLLHRTRWPKSEPHPWAPEHLHGDRTEVPATWDGSYFSTLLSLRWDPRVSPPTWSPESCPGWAQQTRCRGCYLGNVCLGDPSERHWERARALRERAGRVRPSQELWSRLLYGILAWRRREAETAGVRVSHPADGVAEAAGPAPDAFLRLCSAGAACALRFCASPVSVPGSKRSSARGARATGRVPRFPPPLRARPPAHVSRVHLHGLPLCARTALRYEQIRASRGPKHPLQ